MNIPFYQRLNFKQARNAVLIALLLGFGFAIYQLYLDFTTEREKIDDTVHLLLNSVKAPAAQAAYIMHNELALDVLNGLFNHPSIYQAKLYDDFGRTLAEKKRNMTKTRSHQLTRFLFGEDREYQVILEDSEKAQIGTLVVIVDLHQLVQSFYQRSWVLILSGLFSNLLLAAVLSILFYFTLTRSLQGLQREVSSIDPEQPNINPISVDSRHRNDELGQVVGMLNKLLDRFAQTLVQRRQAEDRLTRQANHDDLTDLPNRKQYYRLIHQELEIANASDRKFAVFFIDLDRFKNVNDSLGHHVGDLLLSAVAKRMLDLIDANFKLARIGGDEFAGILTNLNDKEQAGRMAQNILELLLKPFSLQEYNVYINASIGIASYPKDGEDRSTLLKHADLAMFEAKRGGRNNYFFYTPELGLAVNLERELDNDLRHAVKENSFLVYYQPQIDFQSGQIIGLEALIRWNHAEKGFIPPDQFIPFAEETGLINPIGKWILTEACKQLKQWHQQGYKQLQMSVNLSARQISGSDIVETVGSVLQETGLDGKFLTLEVTESVFVGDVEATANVLESLNKLGVSLSIDDFGTGYSSMSYMKRFPFNALKIDREFVRDLFIDDDDTSIVTAIISLGHNMGMKVVAEGIETVEQEAFLKKFGCDNAQGFYYSKPVDAAEIEQNWLIPSKNNESQTSIELAN